MTDVLRIVLPVYFTLFFAIAFVIKSVRVALRIEKNPNVLPADDSAYGLIGFYFKLTLIGMFLYTVLFAFFPALHDDFLPVASLDLPVLKYIGFFLLIFSLFWTVLAQNQMKDSWRIGIETEKKTELVTKGLFSISRNPIFLGMILSLVGLFLLTPNAFTGLVLILGYVLIQIQIRLEEEFLATQHGQEYSSYKEKVRRFL